jgi:hypothetical protein
VIQVANAVLVGPIASFAEKTGLARSPPAGVLDDHGLAQVLVELEVVFSTLHEFGGPWKVLPFPLQRLFT